MGQGIRIQALGGLLRRDRDFKEGFFELRTLMTKTHLGA
jgi:hypothetical protein